jgi:hypothetical protein
MRRRSALGAIAWALLAAVAPPGARGAETWIEADPPPGRLISVWKEGRLESLREGTRPFARISTDGSGAPALIANAAPYAPALDAKRRFPKLLLRIDGAEHLAGIELRLGSDGLKSRWFAFSVPLYADPEYNQLQDGEWTALTLGFGGAQPVGAPERGAIDSMGLLVRDRGTGSVRVDVGGMALVDEAEQGVASVTFDDGYVEHLAAARLMAARGWRGTAYVIPALVGRQGWMGPAELGALAKLGFDVAAHDDLPFTEREPGELGPALWAVQRFLVENGFGRGAPHLAYPLGKQEPRRVRPAVREVFETARLAGGGAETLPPGDPHLLRAVNVVGGMPPAEIGALARRAREHKEWLILMFHHLAERSTQPTEYAMADFARALDELARSGIRVAPVTEVWESQAPPADRARAGVAPPR